MYIVFVVFLAQWKKEKKNKIRQNRTATKRPKKNVIPEHVLGENVGTSIEDRSAIFWGWLSEGCSCHWPKGVCPLGFGPLVIYGLLLKALQMVIKKHKSAITRSLIPSSGSMQLENNHIVLQNKAAPPFSFYIL